YPCYRASRYGGGHTLGGCFPSTLCPGGPWFRCETRSREDRVLRFWRGHGPSRACTAPRPSTWPRRLRRFCGPPSAWRGSASSRWTADGRSPCSRGRPGVCDHRRRRALEDRLRRPVVVEFQAPALRHPGRWTPLPDPVRRRPRYDAKPAVGPELSLGPESLGRDHDGEHLGHPHGANPGPGFEHPADRVTMRLLEHGLLRVTFQRQQRVKLTSQ